MIADPNGEILAGPVNKEESILYAEIDLEMLLGTKWNLDVGGHYARPDAFQLTVNKAPLPILSIREGAPEFNDTEGHDPELTRLGEKTWQTRERISIDT
jgi:nitrilase